jgi:hypothetical protein
MRSSPGSISGGLWHPLMQAQPKTSHFWILVHPQMMIQRSTGTRKCGTHIYFVTLVCPCHLSASATHFYHRGKKKGTTAHPEQMFWMLTSSQPDFSTNH